MAVVSVRLADEDVAFLREQNANVSEIIRGAVHREIEWLRHVASMEYLASVRIPYKVPAEDIIREDRDHAH